MKSKYRILIVSHNSFSKVHNNGKTLESFFSGFEKENLAQLYFCSNENPDFDYCRNYYQITDRDVLNNLLYLNSKSREVVRDPIKEFDINENKLFKYAKKISSHLNLFRDFLWKTYSWNTLNLRKWCRDFNPDAIFYVGGNYGFSHVIAVYISKLLKKPLIVYFTDDYLIFPYERNLIEKIQRWRMKRFYKKTIDHSSLRFVIGELMAYEYEKYFGKVFYPIMNSLPVVPYIPYKIHDKVIISYFGGLHLNRWKMIIRLAKLIDNVEFNIYSVVKPSQKILEEFSKVGIFYKGSLEGPDLYNTIINSDILLHVESDDSYYKSLTRLSISTKIPEYLASGRVILGFGPTEVASMRLLSDHNIGIVVASTSNEIEIKAVMNNLISNFELRRDIGFKGYTFAVNNFNNDEIVKKFTQKIELTINNWL